MTLHKLCQQKCFRSQWLVKYGTASLITFLILQTIRNDVATSVRYKIEGLHLLGERGLAKYSANVSANATTETMSANVNKGLTTWDKMLTQCKLIYYIHIPKTAGTSVLTSLKSLQTYIDIDRPNVYNSDAVNLAKSIQQLIIPVIKNATSLQQSIIPAIEKGQLGQERQFVTTAETGLNRILNSTIITSQDQLDLLIDDTCYFSTLRDPLKWMISAENHLRTKDGRIGYHHGWAYFDADNIQSIMTGYLGGNSSVVDVMKQLKICLFDATSVGYVLKSLGAPPLGVHNRGEYEPNVTQELYDHLNKRYYRDIELWEKLKQNNGVLCF